VNEIVNSPPQEENASIAVALSGDSNNAATLRCAIRDVYDLERNARILKQGDPFLHELRCG